MNALKFVVIIPARFASTRFPGKPLAEIGGKTMIQRVYEQALKIVVDVYVATDDQRIFDEVERFGGKVVMTSDQHRSGTDRCYEAYTKLQEKYDVIINIQGDEPFIQPEQITALQHCFDDAATDIATLVKKIDSDDTQGVLFNPNSPKVVLGVGNVALYFSRSPIPYLRSVSEKEWASKHVYFKHIGVYAYKASVLKDLTALEPSILEKAESLEQLRWLENGYRIKVGFSEVETVGIDTPDDLEKARKLLSC
jgi:3-deoxy-manno-octulosonate cytidylyltransferase (CMP-KDO synthetase)